MHNLAKDERIYNISTLFALLIRCPLGIQEDSVCPFRKFRNLDELKKYYLAENFSVRQRDKLLSKHRACQQEKLKTIKALIQ
ncbi:MAG: hypothetical protein KAS94_13395 [Desulfobulbaceae bacterium]|nr:hypothetical protein [Desulfobulbaceae bacterium]